MFGGTPLHDLDPSMPPDSLAKSLIEQALAPVQAQLRELNQKLLGYIPTELADATSGFEIEIIGRRRPAHLQHEPVLDPEGLRMRA